MKNFTLLTQTILEIFRKMSEKRQSSMTPSSGQTGQVSGARSTSRDSSNHYLLTII